MATTTSRALGYEFTLAKETKNYVRYEPPEGQNTLGAIYVARTDLAKLPGSGVPQVLLVTVEIMPEA